MAYLSFKSVWAVNSCGSTVGTPRTGSLVAMPSSEVYSVCTQQAGQAAVSYNFNDLSGYVPASAWACQPYCAMIWNSYASGKGGPSQELPDDTPEGLAAAMPPGPGDFYVNDELVFSTSGGYCGPFPYQSWYKPYVAVPPQVRAMDPEWESCELALMGLYDPPVVLTQQTSLAGMTVATAATSTAPSATPAQTTSQPSSTAGPQVSTTPTPATYASQTSSAGDSSAYTNAASSDPADAAVSQTSSTAASLANNIVSLLGESTTDSGPSTSSSVAATSQSPASAASASIASNLLSILEASTTNNDPASSIVQSSDTQEVTSANAKSSVAPASYADQSITQVAVQTTMGVAGVSVTVSQDPTNSLAVVNGNTVTQGAQTTIDGQSVSVGSQGVQVGTTLVSVQTQVSQSADPADPTTSANTAIITAQGQTLTAVAGGENTVIAESSTTVALSQGQPVTIQGQTVSIASDGTQLVVNGASTDAFSAQYTSTSSPLIATVGASAYTASAVTDAQGSSAFVVAAGTSTATLTAGQTTNLGAQVISADSSGAVVIGTGASAATIAAPEISASEQPAAVITAGGKSYTAVQSGDNVVIADSSSTVTIAQGVSTTINGQAVAAVSGANGVIVDGSTALLSQPLSTPSVAVLTGSSGNQLTVVQQGGSYAVEVQSSTVYISAGSGTTIDGQSISVPSVSTESPLVNGQKLTLSAAPSSDQTVASGAVVTAGGATLVTILQDGSSYVLQAGTTRVSLAPGAQTTFAGETLIAPSIGSGAIVKDGSTITFSQVPATVSPIGAIITASGGTPATIYQDGVSYAVQDGSSTISLAAGSSNTFRGLLVSVPTGGSAAIINGQTVVLSHVPSPTPTIGAIITEESGQIATIEQHDSAYLIKDGSSTITLNVGEATTFHGMTISDPQSSSIAVVNGQAVTLSNVESQTTPTDTARPKAVFTDSDGQAVTVVRQGSSYLVQDASTAIEVSLGSQTVFGGETISVPTSGSVIVVDGESRTLSTSTSSAPQTGTTSSLSASASRSGPSASQSGGAVDVNAASDSRLGDLVTSAGLLFPALMALWL
jgi:trimeric autotransporter adhesin